LPSVTEPENNLSAEFTACKNNRRQQTTAGVDVQALIFFFFPQFTLYPHEEFYIGRLQESVHFSLLVGGLIDHSLRSLPGGKHARDAKKGSKNL
jgi:hypothetical protein